VEQSTCYKSAVWSFRVNRFHLWASNFSFSLPDGQGLQSSDNWIKNSKLRLAQGKHNLRAAYSKDKLKFWCFFLALEQLHVSCIGPSATPLKPGQLVDMHHLWVECTMSTIQCLKFFLHGFPCEIHSSLYLESDSIPTTNHAFLLEGGVGSEQLYERLLSNVLKRKF